MLQSVTAGRAPRRWQSSPSAFHWRGNVPFVCTHAGHGTGSRRLRHGHGSHHREEHERPSTPGRAHPRGRGAGSRTRAQAHPPPRTMASRNDPSLCDCTVCHAYRLIWTDARGRTVTQQRQSGSCNGDVHVRVPARVSLPRFRRSYQHLVHGTSVNPAKEREWAHDGSPVTNPQTSPPHLRQRDGAIGL